ncbi:DUF2946 domain-containing protein [Bradyrhizobium sp. CCGUVB23]|uniref:DUF2946 domain-containing protein n=1 Tax=Bradyrhizobium sp. CCGUVB23 TaxID=2949630 RepID=UPI0020B3A6BF|nr:DUF2946 domain-containing protein [Bradyrhizobium sp. CCGUVB23]MCP3466084.1 DUF2946 domain-containing protein [Bradyrhizobium sp. CCGUVB23]
MRARLQKYLPIVLIALAMQVLAPIAACWAAGIAVADPLQNAVICHASGDSGAGIDHRTSVPGSHAGACSLCCLAQASASLDAPQTVFAAPVRPAERVAWHDVADRVALPHAGSNAQARAPPQFS